jgi:hypothetical protein
MTVLTVWMIIGVVLTMAGCWFGSIEVHVYYTRAPGVTQGERVLFEQKQVGRIEDVRYEAAGRYRTTLAVKRTFGNALTEYSQFFIIDDPERSGSKAVEIRLTRSGGVPLADGASVNGASLFDEMAAQWTKELEKGLQFLEKQLREYGRAIEGIPDSEEYRQLMRSLQEWAEEMARSSEDARQKVEKKWLPLIEKQVEALRQWMRERGLKEDLAPIEKEVERIRNI